MLWKESKTMDLRVQLIQDYEEGESISALAEIYGVARKTIYKWLERHDAGGVAGLADRSRAPRHSPHRLSADVIAHLIAARQRWKWGPRKLRVKLASAHPHLVWPAESTIGEVLKRAGLTHRRQPRVRTPPYAQPFASIDAANQTWCADFKGCSATETGGAAIRSPSPTRIAVTCCAARSRPKPTRSTWPQSSTPRSANTGCRW